MNAEKVNFGRTISVILPLYNGEAFVEEQVKSILGQTCPPDELVIIDDCSTDNSVEVVKNIDDDRIILRRNQENIGLVANIQRALAMSKGDLVFLSDQDDVWLRHKVEQMNRYMDKNPTCYLAISDCAISDSELNITDQSYIDNHLGDVTALQQFLRFRVLGSSMCIRRELAEFSMQMFAPYKVYHDVVLYFCCRIAFGPIGVVPEPLYLYRRHESTLSTAAAGSNRSWWSIAKSRGYTAALIFRAVLASCGSRIRRSLKAKGQIGEN